MCSKMCPCKEPKSVEAKNSWTNPASQDDHFFEIYGRDIQSEPLVWVTEDS